MWRDPCASALAVLTRPDPTGLTTHGADAPLEGAVAAVLEVDPLSLEC